MDLHAWITQQVDHVELLIDEGEFPPSQADGVRLRCEADRRILARHRIDPAFPAFAGACEGCGLDDWALPNIESVNDCPELLDLAHAHGITPEILASLDRPTPPEPQPQERHRLWGVPTSPITTSQVPAALRGPRWKP
ncbi:hypothetical protein [Streptomyces sp. E5N298]|uniref:hypothetical protein n=1 Tax=Streptomyces sp. E5N298 TaxID=1851983 RepID=UPI000EF5AC72|nr:hypothetical protein [Streptomyces sp. E5N298]